MMRSLIHLPRRLRPRKKAFKRKKGRSFRDRPCVRAPRNARLNTLLAFDANMIKSTETLRKYRTGFNYAWRNPKAQQVMLKAGFKAPGLYRETNQHAGRMFALPREVPCANRFGEEEAGFVMRYCLYGGGTRSQCENVSKLLSYIHQLQTGEAKGNFKKVRQCWDHFDEDRFAEPTQRVRAIHIIRPEYLKKAMLKEWTQETCVPYKLWCLGFLIVYDWCINGCRPKVDLGRVKSSKDTQIFPAQGFMFSEMDGGRAKIEGIKGTRAWKTCRLCHHPEEKHQPLPPNWRDILEAGQNPTWCTTCPLTCYEVIRRYLDDDEDPRIYPSVTKHGDFVGGDKGYISMGSKTMFPFARQWLNIQGGNPDGIEFDSNMGRKCLGRLCDVTNMPYPESFEITGDLFKNWRHYQEACLNDRNFIRRTQSPDMDLCLKGLRRIARWFGRGPTVSQDPDEFNLTQVGQLLALRLRLSGHGAEVNKILS